MTTNHWLGRPSHALAGLAWFAACTPLPAATQAKASTPSAPAVVAPPPLPSAVVVASPARFTTRANSDVCVELAPRERTDFATFSTKIACEDWVENRHCRPGFRCFDGCNWRSCDDSGSSIEETLALCSPRVARFVFEPGQSRLPPATNSTPIVDAISTRLKAPERKLRVRGYAAASEAKNDAAVTRLAQARADAVARELAKRGIPRPRLVVDVGTAAELPAQPPEHALVMVSLLPEAPLRSDFEPSSGEYQLFCAASSTP